MAYNKEEHVNYVDWADEKVEQWIQKMKPYYSPKGLEYLKFRIKEIVGAGALATGVADFVFGGRVQSVQVKTLFHKSYDEQKQAVEKFLENIYKLVKGLQEKDYDTARAAYNEELATFAGEPGENNRAGLYGSDFLVHKIIPGSKVTGYVYIIQEDLQRALNGKVPDWMGLKTPEERESYLENEAQKIYSLVSSVDRRNIDEVYNEINGKKLLYDCLKMVKTEAEKIATSASKPAELGEN